MEEPHISAVFEEQPPVPPEQTEGAQSATPPPPEEPPPAPVKKPLPYVAIIVATVVIALALTLYLRTSIQPAAPIVAEVTPTLSPNPTQPSRLSAVATTSAFASFDSSLASLSANIGSFTLTDAALTPPTLDLELGLAP